MDDWQPAPEWVNRHSWVTAQLRRAPVLDSLAKPVGQLLETLWDQRLSNDDREKVIRAFSDLARDRALDLDQFRDDAPDEPEWTWVPVRPGQIVMQDFVRVRADAYKGPAGMHHNGRSGHVVAIRYGDVHVLYEAEGALPRAGVAARHSPFKLEKKVVLPPRRKGGKQ